MLYYAIDLDGNSRHRRAVTYGRSRAIIVLCRDRFGYTDLLTEGKMELVLSTTLGEGAKQLQSLYESTYSIKNIFHQKSRDSSYPFSRSVGQRDAVGPFRLTQTITVAKYVARKYCCDLFWLTLM